MLGTRAKSASQNTASFIKKLLTYVLVNFKSPGILSRAVADLDVPHVLIKSDIPHLINKTVAYLGITQVGPTENETTTEKDLRLQQNRMMMEPATVLYAQEMSQFAKQKNQLIENMAKLWGIIFWQCTKALIESLRAEHNFEAQQITYNAIWLLKSIKQIIKFVPHSIHCYAQFLLH